MSLKIFVYENASISFNDGERLMVNATQMAKAFGKKPQDYLRLESTQEFINEYMVENLVTGNPVTVVQGGKEQGTWMHEDIALDFARWLSPKFALWCNARIKELLITGKTSLPEPVSEDHAILAGYRLAIAKIDRLEVENKALLMENSALAPKAEVFDKVMDASNLLNATQVAQNMGLSAVALNKKLAEKKVQRKMGDGTWVLNAEYLNLDYARLVPYPITVRDGKTITKNNLMWTEKGRHFISQLLAA